jgi:hypothetical protein
MVLHTTLANQFPFRAHTSPPEKKVLVYPYGCYHIHLCIINNIMKQENEMNLLIDLNETINPETNVLEDLFDELDVQYINREWEKKYNFKPLKENG